MKKPASIPETIARLEALCARSEQCSADIRRKLFDKGITGPAAQKILQHLLDNRYIDDNRFAQAFVRDKYRFARWGRIKIIAGLAAKRIPRTIIDDAIAQIDSREYALTAFRVLRAKLRTLDSTLPRHELRARLLRFGLSRGYESALIIRITYSQRLWQAPTE